VRLDLAGNVFIWAAVPAFLVAWRFKSFFGAVVVGMATVALARLLLG
jgi:branched-subunit amino acid transport protein